MRLVEILVEAAQRVFAEGYSLTWTVGEEAIELALWGPRGYTFSNASLREAEGLADRVARAVSEMKNRLEE